MVVRIIQKQNHPMLSRYISFDDKEMNIYAAQHHTKKEAIQYCQDHPCKDPSNFPKNYL